MKLHSAARSDVGLEREHNEDHFRIVESSRLFIVADGIGGQAAGEVASKLACDAVAELFEFCHEPGFVWPYAPEPDRPDTANRLACAIRVANDRIHAAAAENTHLSGMATTIVAAAIEEEAIAVAHVGDARAYRLRGDRIEQMTRDHSLLEAVKTLNPQMTEEQEARFQHKNVVTRALGLPQPLEVDMLSEQIEPGDVFLLCTDGLSGMLDDGTILRVVKTSASIDEAVQRLVGYANAAGGRDNVTVVLIERSQ